jgi:small conductance mechanosensitive channel
MSQDAVDITNRDLISSDAVNKAITAVLDWFSANQAVFEQYATNLVMAIAIFVFGKWIVNYLTASMEKLLIARELDKTLVDFFKNVTRYLLLAMVLIAALSQLGVQTAQIIALVGAAGLAVGLALQGSLSNFAAGVLIIVFRPFKSGEYVELDGVSGSVASIELFSTVLTTPDNKMVVVPNGKVISSPITNYSRHATRRVDLMVGVSYKADLQQTKAILARVLEADSRVLPHPEPVIGVSMLGDSSVNFVVRPWVKTQDYWNVYFDLTQAIKEALDKEGIEIPYPQMDVHYHSAA